MASAKKGNRIVSQQEYEAAKKLVIDTQAALSEAMSAYSSIGDPVYKGVTYKGPEGKKKLQEIVNSLKVPAKEATRKLEVIEAPIKAIQSQIDKIDEKLKPVSEREKKVGAKNIPGAERKRLTALKTSLESKLNVQESPAKEQTPAATTTATPAATTEKPVTTTTIPAKTPLMNNLQNPSSRNKVGAPPTGSSTGGGGIGGGAGGTTTTSTARPKNPKKGDTWTGPKGMSWQYNGSKWVATEKAESVVDYEALKAQFPQYSWILDLDPQYDDLKKITVDKIEGKITQERWNELAPGTSWFRNKTTVDTARRIKTRFGDIPFADGGFSKLVNDTINLKYDDKGLDLAFYGEAFKKDPITGQYVNDAAAKTVLKGTSANQYRTYAKNMFSSVSDDTIISLLTGEKTVEDFDRSLRTVAKNVYGNLAQQLDDPTMDMATIVRPWQEHAAKVLELDPSQIDMTLPQFQIAYSGNTENGQTKALSIGEWNQKLRTDSIYNWKNTNTAKQGARNLAFNIASAFGKII